MRLALAALVLLAAPAAAQAPLAERLDALVAAHAAEGFSGVVLVGRGDSTLYARAVGLADRGWGLPNALDTRFPWASVTKQVVAVAVLQLVGERRLSLDTPLGAVLPGLRAEAAGRVPVRALLSNASGLPDMESLPGVYVAPDSAVSALVDAALRADLAFEPGSAFRYNNLDFVVLGRVLEALDGRPLSDVLRTRVFEPAGMAETVLLSDARVEPRLAAGVLRLADGREVPPPPTRLASYGASAALAGPAGDLLRFDRALLGGRLLSPALLDTLVTPDPALGFVALSVWTYGFGDVRAVERQGWIGGHRALNVLVPERGLALVVLANTDAADVSRTYTGQGFSARVLREVLAGP